MDWTNKVVLVTGGTGSFGKKFIEVMLKEYHPAKLIIFSRDELKQHEMRAAGFEHPSLRYFIGDVRDLPRLCRAFEGVDIVIHTAALKQVPACEYNPMEAVKTNILGSSNVIDAALDAGVEKVLALSTDKAVNPVNLYGATKLAAEKLFIQSNYYAGLKETRLSCTRYGNVVGSRGSVVPVFIKQRNNGGITITDERMTRFWISLEQGARFVIRCVEQMHGGEVFVPKIPSMAIMDLARAIAPETKVHLTGIRPGEKLHEVLISEDEARTTVELDDMFVVMPAMSLPIRSMPLGRDWESLGKALPDGFRYASNTNPQWLSIEQIQNMVAPIEAALFQGRTRVKRLLVTGVSGLLGLNLAWLARDRYQVTGVLRGERAVAVPSQTPFDVVSANLNHPGQVERVLEIAQPDAIIHCAALTNVDSCETYPDEAYQSNARLPGLLARAAQQNGARLIHISTDAIFDGLRGDYSESDQPSPINVYARTKLEGERAVADANADAVIARVNFYGWSWIGQRSLAEYFFNNLQQRNPVYGFTDLIFCPLLVNDLVEILLKILERNLSGIYHVVSSESQSKFAFGRMLARHFGLDENLIAPASYKIAHFDAPRSPLLNLRSDKLAGALGEVLPDQESAMRRYAELYFSGYAQTLRSALVKPDSLAKPDHTLAG